MEESKEKKNILLAVKSIFIRRRYGKDLRSELLTDNFNRLFAVLSFLIPFEIYLYIIQDKIFSVGSVIFVFLILCIVFYPVIWYFKRRTIKANFIVALAVQYSFCALVIIFGEMLALYVQKDIDLIHMYLMMVFFTAAFIYMHPLHSAILFLLTYIYFFIMLPFYVYDPSVRLIMKINTAGSNFAAWIMSVVIWKTKVTVFKNKKQLNIQNKILHETSQKDSMTGLYNHETSLRILQTEIEKVKIKGGILSLVIADIDDFKNVNDEFGHLMGDLVIKGVSKIIESSVRKSDFVGRYGGEEFIIIMPDTSLHEAEHLAERIRSEISSANLCDNVSITLSGGVSQYFGEKIDDFIRMTDKKLYVAKESGKNRFETEM